MNLPKDFPFNQSEVYTYGVRNGIVWAVVQAPTGYAYNGYVRVPDGHPWYDIGSCEVFLDEIPYGELTYGKDNWVGFDTLHYGQHWPEDPSSLVASDSIEMSVPLVVEWTLRLADAAVREGEARRSGPNGCTAAINIAGEHFWCVETVGHATPGDYTSEVGHRNPRAQAVWAGDTHADPSTQELAPKGTVA